MHGSALGRFCSATKAYLRCVFLEGGNDVAIHQMHGGESSFEGQSLAWLSQPRVAVNGSLQVDLSDAFENPDEEGADGHQSANKWRFDVAFAELKQNLSSWPAPDFRARWLLPD